MQFPINVIMRQVDNFKKITLVGVPNSGKTSLFNQLTGDRQRVGNWSGVTVEKKEGFYIYNNKKYQVIDLPGFYTFNRYSKSMAIDEKISCDFLLSGEFNVIVNVLDVTALERQLYLTRQLFEHNLPVIIALNYVDNIKKESLSRIIKNLSQEFSCPVVLLKNISDNDCSELKEYINNNLIINQYDAEKPYDFHLSSIINFWKEKIESTLRKKISQGLVLQALEGDVVLKEELIDSGIDKKFSSECCKFAGKISQLRTESNCFLVKQCNINIHDKLTEKIDNFVLNRFLGIPVFLFVMYMMFVFSIKVGGRLAGFFDLTSQALFIDLPVLILGSLKIPEILIQVVKGVGIGLNVTLTFVPVIGCMFLFLSVLESTGYIARAAFVVDKLMQFVGLSGKSFVPMIIGFGCNVPAILSARTLEHQRERIATIMMSPFMSCGARMAIYTIFVAAFFPDNGHNIIFYLYIIGILVAILTGKILHYTVLSSDYSPTIMELPKYRLPAFKVILQVTWHRLKKFLKKAGSLILPICMVLSLLTQGNIKDSAIANVGKTITPIFYPMGIKQENWPATVSLLTGVLAKEVVVGTLTSLYDNSVTNEIVSIKDKIIAGVESIYGSDDDEIYEESTLRDMYVNFGSQSAAFAYLLFVLLYVPCISVLASIAKELNRKWAFFGIGWTFYIAYAVSVIFYQIANFNSNPVYAFNWILMLLSGFGGIILILKHSSYAELKTKAA